MGAQRRSRNALGAIAMASALLASPGIASASWDSTPPTGRVTGVTLDAAAQTATLAMSYGDPESGVDHVTISCDDSVTEPLSLPYAATITVRLRGTDSAGCVSYGYHYLEISIVNGAGVSAWSPQLVEISPNLALDLPLPAITGHLFTIDPQWPSDYTHPAGGGCRWEFRWGNDRSLNLNEFDETFASLLFDVKSVNGDCAAWTFNLPWVPYRQYEVYVSTFTIEPDGGYLFGVSAYRRFTASVDGTEKRITTSTLPIAQVLPSTYTPVVGRPVTYTRYLVGGATAGTSVWTAHQGTGNYPNYWTQNGGATFTITPSEPGNITVGWDMMSGAYRLGAVYDPPIRYRDYYRPNTTAPVQRIGTGTLETTVPVTLTWTGTDRGWGIDRYQLDRSVDGGAWRRVVTTRSKSYVQSLPTGHGYRYRVRAIDKYGNIGYWDYGPTFRPRTFGDAASSVTYAGAWTRVADSTARGGFLHETDTASARVTFTFTGRDVAWLAERGPTHGRARVYVDGSYVATVDLTATSETPRRIVFRRHWSTQGTHALRIVVEGTAGRRTVDVDGFLVLR